MKHTSVFIISFILLLSAAAPSVAQRKKNNQPPTLLSDSLLSGLKFRNIGPALMSGRISDLAIHPNNENIWYVTAGSGGVWKTLNAGTTWKPIFDKQTVYSIGCVNLDPSNPEIVWIGTGENVGGRHVSFGDGIYRSSDGGANWTHMGLKKSEHISKIIVHPSNSNIIWVAAQGPLWNKGGDRGLYRSEDGGKSWEKTLGDNEWTGVTDLVMDPRNHDTLYAATWQRHRTVAAYMGGGPGSGLHKSTDGGQTWTQLKKGLPESNMGKIGLAISPQKPDILYAAIELDRRTGGVYRSVNRGETWEKMSDAVSGATGPHYYQELYASPHQFGKLYLVDVRMQISDDEGRTFRRMKEEHKHSDNHAIAFKKNDPDYLLVGTDGGLYESFDLAENWRFVDNLPLTQFYKLAVDDTEPFYNIYGGTQDNSTQGGPSRTDNVHGIQNSDWKLVLNWDGHQPATEPGNPSIMYAERQEGNISRVDLINGEIIDIQPQPAAEDPFERYNWDAPILVSPHLPTRLYFASQRVWRSENRGDRWKAISPDLTKNQERITLPIMGKRQGWDEAWDFLAMSNYNTITSLAESPVQEDLLYAGTDDGLIQISENGGQNWRKIEVNQLPGVPSTAFVNDIKADLYDASTVYVALDNHKYGDFKPYVYKSTDKGRSWVSISGNLKAPLLIWRLQQDHVKPELLFLATEFGLYTSPNTGKNWVELKGGVPRISFRDIAIQRRENDLVGASFGRGFFVLDDYSPLREITAETLKKEAFLFTPRDAWWYVPRPKVSFDDKKGAMGASYYVADNPPFGAVFTYYIKDKGYLSDQAKRQEKEKKTNGNIPFPGWEALEEEALSGEPMVFLEITDNQGAIVRKIKCAAKGGLHRVNWDLRFPPLGVIVFDEKKNENEPQGLPAPPGNYNATLYKTSKGKTVQLSQPVSFAVKPMGKSALKGASPEKASAFWRRFESMWRKSSAFGKVIENNLKKVDALSLALSRSNLKPGPVETQLYEQKANLFELQNKLSGSKIKAQPGEKSAPNIDQRVFALYRGVYKSTYGPTDTHLWTSELVEKELQEVEQKLQNIKHTLKSINNQLAAAGAPLIER